MGVEYYNPSSSNSSNGNFVLYRMKPQPVSNILYPLAGAYSYTFPVLRSGVTDKYFSNGSVNTGITLYTVDHTTGASISVAAITYTTYLTSSTLNCLHYNSTDQCLYALLQAGTSFLFIKINDTTGVVTAIGSSFTPTTVSDWGSAGTGSLEIDSGTGHLKFTCNGKYHLINKTTGAIVSQGNVIVIGAYSTVGVKYVTADGTVGLTKYGVGTSSAGDIGAPSLISSAYGVVPPRVYTIASFSYLYGGSGGRYGSSFADAITLIDNDKVCFYSGVASGSNDCTGWVIFLRSEFDKAIKSLVDVGIGVV